MKKSRLNVVEICNHCGRSVARWDGSYVNRVLDCNDILTRIQSYRPFPHGDFVCEYCDNKTSDVEPMNLN